MQQSDNSGFIGQMIIVPSGATNAVLMEAVGGQGSAIIKYGSGGSLEIVQAPCAGISFPTGATTWAGASLVALNGTGYLMGAAEAIQYDGAARYYLIATGATAIAYSLKGLTPSF